MDISSRGSVGITRFSVRNAPSRNGVDAHTSTRRTHFSLNITFTEVPTSTAGTSLITRLTFSSSSSQAHTHAVSRYLTKSERCAESTNTKSLTRPTVAPYVLPPRSQPCRVKLRSTSTNSESPPEEASTPPSTSGRNRSSRPSAPRTSPSPHRFSNRRTSPFLSSPSSPPTFTRSPSIPRTTRRS